MTGLGRCTVMGDRTTRFNTVDGKGVLGMSKIVLAVQHL